MQIMTELVIRRFANHSNDGIGVLKVWSKHSLYVCVWVESHIEINIVSETVADNEGRCLDQMLNKLKKQDSSVKFID